MYAGKSQGSQRICRECELLMVVCGELAIVSSMVILVLYFHSGYEPSVFIPSVRVSLKWPLLCSNRATRLPLLRL